MPPTTGGSTIGRSVSARTTRRPGYATRAWTHASGTPSTTAIAVAPSDVTKERRSAVSASWLDRTDHADDHGARQDQSRERDDEDPGGEYRADDRDGGDRFTAHSQLETIERGR